MCIYNENMICIENALNLVNNNSSPIKKTEEILLSQALGFVLAEDVISPINMPPFRQSAMDGYALHLHEALTYNLSDMVKAGDNYHPVLKKGDAIRIFTGAPVPDSANTIIMQEKVTVDGYTIILDDNISVNLNIRPLGEQVKKGDVALKKGNKLNPAAIGYLNSLGITEVFVYKKPSIALITTGNELIEAGQPLSYGKIYESNSKMLKSALLNLGFDTVSTYKIDDDYSETQSIIETVIHQNDLVIITGGISVGDYDFVGKALHELNVETLFYKVKQKPGKPLFFGKKNDTIVFALPGNPAAALTCFYVYVYTALQKITGANTHSLPRIKAKSNSVFLKIGDRPQFLKASYTQDTVTILEGQSSAMLQTYAISNALVFLPEHINEIKVNDMVEVILLPV